MIQAADKRQIPYLNILSPPSDSELIPLMVPAAFREPCRPTADDITLYKDTAANVLLLLCHKMGVESVEGSLSPEFRAPAFLKPTVANNVTQPRDRLNKDKSYDPGPALLAEIRRHGHEFHPDDTKLWYTIVETTARLVHQPQLIRILHSSGEKTLTIQHDWSTQIFGLFRYLSPHQATERREAQLQVALHQLRTAIGSREKRKVRIREIVAKVRYFFIEPYEVQKAWETGTVQAYY